MGRGKPSIRMNCWINLQLEYSPVVNNQVNIVKTIHVFTRFSTVYFNYEDTNGVSKVP